MDWNGLIVCWRY